MSGDVEIARKLLAEKAELRAAELAAAESHFERLREGRPESIETTLAASGHPARPQAHPLAHLLGRLSGARAAGELQVSRLKEVERERDAVAIGDPATAILSPKR